MGTFSTNPIPGMLYIFPSNLLHTVYPFKGDGERRSIAFNGLHKFKKEVNDDSDK